MQKKNWVLAALIAGVAAIGAPTAVQAADVGPGTSPQDSLPTKTGVSPGFVLAGDGDVAIADSTAQFAVTPGSLALVQVPDLHYADATIAELVNGATLALDGSAIKEPDTGPGYDGTAAGMIEVQDYRGTNAGWSLSGALADFTNDGVTVTPTSATFGAATPTGDNAGNVAFSTGNFAQASLTLLNAPKDAGTGSTTAEVRGGSLSLAKAPDAVPGDYRAKMTWTLAATPNP